MKNESDRSTRRLAMLGDLPDYGVAQGYPDIRGWNVCDAGGRTVGKVHDLVVDTEGMRTRYLDVRLDGAAAGINEDREVLIPVGTARLDDRHDNVTIDAATGSRLANLPRFTHGDITREEENALLTALGTTAVGAAGSFYEGRHFDDRAFYGDRKARSDRVDRDLRTDREVPLDASDTEVGRLNRSEEELYVGKRQIKEGEVDVRKSVETEHIARPVTTSHEEVIIERNRIDAARARDREAKIGEEQIRVPLVEEEAIVEKRPIVKEEIVVKKHAVPDTKQVEADIRKERVEIEDTTHGRGLHDKRDRDRDFGDNAR